MTAAKLICLCPFFYLLSLGPLRLGTSQIGD